MLRGFHFDPVIIYPGFEKDYEYLIDDIGRILDLERVIWVSLGLLRFPPRLFDEFMEKEEKNPALRRSSSVVRMESSGTLKLRESRLQRSTIN